MQFSCTYTETQGVYGTVSVNNNLVASHAPVTADANHVFSLLNGMLKVEIPNNAGNGTDYRLVDGVLSVNPGFTGALTAEYVFTTAPTREIDFEYDHNGLRTQKKVVENGITTVYDYTLHGKLITHLTKRTVDENGDETTQELHFFYDAQSKPAFVEYGDVKYRYIHNLQGDIVAIVDSVGRPVVEYKYDAWGNHISAVPELGVGAINPFRYRGFVWDEDVELYYLRNRYYCPKAQRFIIRDVVLGSEGKIYQHNGFCYASNCPVTIADYDGFDSVYILYDARPDASEGGKGFPNQTKWWEETLISEGYTVEKKGYTSIDEFVDAWNEMPDGDTLMIIGHGAKGTLDCNGQRLGVAFDPNADPEITHLSSELNGKVFREVYLFTCHGATSGYKGISLADMISEKTKAPTYAVKNGKLNYERGTGIPKKVARGTVWDFIVALFTARFVWVQPKE